MQSSLAVLALLLIAIITRTTQSRLVQVPYVSSDDTLYLKLDELHSADLVFNVFGDLKRVYQKEVFEIVEGKEVAFPSCYEQAPEANFWAYSQLSIGTQSVKRDAIIYDFEQIKYPRNLIDIETYRNKIFFVKEDGVIIIATISSDLRTITVNKKITTQIQKLAQGNLIILPNATDGNKKGFGILITSKQAIVFDLEGESFVAISNLNSMTGYESAIPIEGRFIASAFGEEGAKIFTIDFALKQLKLQSQLSSTTLKQKSVNIQDLAYDSKRKILFILDHHVGVIPLQLIINGDSLQTRLTSSIIKNSFCNVIYYDSFNDQLYLNCRELHKYRINNWPLFTEKVLPRQEISIREITSNKDIVALVGRNVFELIAMERKVAVYDDRLLDKLILQDKFFVSGNENYLLVGKYQVTPPSVTCLPSSSQSIGRHKVLFKVTAQCNAEYFKAIQFSPGGVSGDDKCVYSVYRNIKIWKGKSIEVKIFVFISLVIAGLGLAVLIYWGASYFNFRKLQNQLRNYESLEEDRFGQTSSTEQKQPGTTTKQKPTLSQKASDQEGRHELNEDIDVPADVHDIE